jgi:hypothetical protein
LQARTGADGRASITVGSTGRGNYTITASARSYSNGTTALRIG